MTQRFLDADRAPGAGVGTVQVRERLRVKGVRAAEDVGAVRVTV